MTILPKRNKRRLETREQDPAQQHVQPGPASPLEVQTSGHHHQASAQIENTHTHNQCLSINPQAYPYNSHAGHQAQRLSSSYCGLVHNHRNEIRPQTGCIPTDTKWRKSPPIRQVAPSEEKYVPPHKRLKRAKSKPKPAAYDNHHKNIDNYPKASKSSKLVNPSAGAASSYCAFLPGNVSSTLQQARQVLIPPVSNGAVPQLSPKMPGGAQEKAKGTGRRPKSPEDRPNSEDEYQNAPSPGGCNSEDEHVASSQPEQFPEELESTFELALKKELCLDIRQMEMDGSCLFRAIADQVYGDQAMHDVVRSHCIDYMAKNSDHFSHYVTEDFNTYLRRKGQLGCHGNHIEVQALSEMYNRPIEVYQYSLKPMNIFHGSYQPESAFPIRISYHRNTHYNSLVDPEKPTIGVGLGLPGFKPRMVEQNLVAEVKASSENYQLEQTMLNDKLRETDWEITDETINEQVARESYLQWLQDCQKQKQRRTPACTVTGPSCSSGTEDQTDWLGKVSPTGSPRQHNTSGSPRQQGSTGSPRQQGSAGSPRQQSGACHSPKSTNKEKEAKTKVISPKDVSSLKQTDSAACGGSDQASSSRDAGLPSGAKPFIDMEPFVVYNYNDNIDENEAIARAIAESQHEYIQSVLKKQ